MSRNSIAFLLMLLTSQLIAQINTTNQSLYWLKYDVKTSVGQNSKFSISAEDRRYFKNNRQHMWLFDMNYSANFKESWNLGGGLLKWSILMPSDPESSYEVTQHEWRPYIFAEHRSTLFDKLKFNKRILIEERIRQNTGTDLVTNGPVIETGYYNYQRIRFRGKLIYKLTKEARVPVFVSVMDEYMIHFGSDNLAGLFDQNRLSVSFQFGILENIDLTLGYLNWFQKSSGNNNYFLRNIAMCYITQMF